jgi:hypothetical protein
MSAHGIENLLETCCQQNSRIDYQEMAFGHRCFVNVLQINIHKLDHRKDKVDRMKQLHYSLLKKRR